MTPIPATPKPSTFLKPFPLRPEGRILILVEGEVTEVKYLRTFMRHFGIDERWCTVVRPNKCSPMGLVQTADQTLRENRSSPYTEAWLVFDVDHHSTFEEAVRQAKNHPFIHLVISKPCIEYWFLHLFGIEHREAFFEKGAPLGSPKRTVEYLPDGRVRETVVTEFEAVNSTDLCVKAATQAIGFSPKKMTFPEKLFEGSRLGEAFTMDFPVAPNQDGAECWTLIPVLLLRLLLLKYDPSAAVLALRTGKRPDRVTGTEPGLARVLADVPGLTRALLEMVEGGTPEAAAAWDASVGPVAVDAGDAADAVQAADAANAVKAPEASRRTAQTVRPMTDAAPHFVVGTPVPVRKFKPGKSKAS